VFKAANAKDSTMHRLKDPLPKPAEFGPGLRGLSAVTADLAHENMRLGAYDDPAVLDLALDRLLDHHHPDFPPEIHPELSVDRQAMIDDEPFLSMTGQPGMDALKFPPQDDQSLDHARQAARRLAEEATRLWSLLGANTDRAPGSDETMQERRCASANHIHRLIGEVGAFLNAEAFKEPDAPGTDPRQVADELRFCPDCPECSGGGHETYFDYEVEPVPAGLIVTLDGQKVDRPLAGVTGPYGWVRWHAPGDDTTTHERRGHVTAYIPGGVTADPRGDTEDAEKGR
jgi:hypothetical protein